MSHARPIVQGRLDSPLAWLSKPLNGLVVDDAGQLISRGQFLAHVSILAKHLPEVPYALNLCDNRYLFLVAAWAVLLRKQTSLLPPNRNAATQMQLSERYQNAYAVHDGQTDLHASVQAIDISQLDWSLASFNEDIPTVEPSHLAIISFTSGSTGESKPNHKTWRALEQSSAINAAHMLPNSDELFYHLATVPGQHMWGLETSVLLPVFANACLIDARPMFPKDISDLISRMPSPRALISTPLHLRAFSMAQADSSLLSDIENVLCATAPLTVDLAVKIESQFGATLREVYGCSEVGSMAVRRTAQTQVWQQFKGLSFELDDNGQAQVSAPYLPAAVILEDCLEMLPNDQFTLAGRVSDQIKIAGKRGSLHEVNAVLSRFEGLVDGVVIFPEQDRLVPRLVAMVVLEREVEKLALRDHLRQFLDAAFVPRPIYLVEALPREENGKLSKSKLLDLYSELSSR